ncbi:glycoside hydrolase family 2 protein [Hymenobacter sp. GOD-10R]|uniref:glycoside hydrolase family 2 protein n=1 Tax=Hymenobacter sp. GOD-10R TaxID=3093922 RepID=UPI002D783EF4|nr:sugar-binding domain-containing protein [Hymenobacter sp. GOD-10R]WRQ26150.1 sugar-binding domain-containing protein [Hymenobacter sp. GOD-10R]
MLFPFKLSRLIVLGLLICASWAQAQTNSARTVVDLSAQDWRLWLDRAAPWVQDRLYAPPVNLAQLPVNPPTGGWEALQNASTQLVHLPATVEQYFWGQNGNAFGLSGNYLGVSWFSTKLAVPAAMQGKRVVLRFESVRLRAEVFVNRQLAGYDLVNSTPFEIDITKFVRYGQDNEVAVRITDPNGNFDWRDSQTFMWGNYRIQPTHGFGGITGKVELVATDPVYVQDVFVKNKPRLDEIEVQVTTDNQTTKPTSGTLHLEVREHGGAQRTVFAQDYPQTQVPAGQSTKSMTVRVKNAKQWSVEAPNLYVLTATWRGADHTQDSYQQRFGFRWFEVRDVAGGDRQFFLNSKRIVLRTSISWGFWPVNGIAPSDALARKQVETAKALGLNMLNFHRTIGQTNVLDYADELGLLYFEEPGGNQYPANGFNPTDSLGRKQADFYFPERTEKVMRMIRRDRNHPALVIYNFHNERGAPPQGKDSMEMRAAHQLDPTRLMTYNSSNGDPTLKPNPRFKLHLRPYDSKFYDYGWFDQHHAGGPGVYHDNLYSSPTKYLRYTDHQDEIVYYGEEGAIGTPPRLQLIRDEILKTGKNIGWETASYLAWYDTYDQFLTNTPGFRQVFPTVDALTTAMGNNAYYYQGRAIENIRLNNTVDGYAVNGWESMMLENHSGIVDNYRNPKGDVQLIARYNRPVYVAVKPTRKVLGVGDTSRVDFHLINEVNLKGSYRLRVLATDEQGRTVLSKMLPVRVTGGTKYGELLSASLPLIPTSAGYTTIKAELLSGGNVVASGDDKLYAVKLNAAGIPAAGMVADTSGVLGAYLKSVGVNSFQPFKSGRPQGKYLLVGAFNPQQTGNPLVTDILEWVNEGNTLIVVNNIDKWATHLGRKEVVDYRGLKELGTSWYGGNYFAKNHPLFAGLPPAGVFNWEYQCFATYDRNRVGLRLFNGETIVACVSDHKKEVYSALSIVPHGRGHIVLCALDIFSTLRGVKVGAKAEGDGENAALTSLNSTGSNKANIVGQQLLLNMLRWAGAVAG